MSVEDELVSIAEAMSALQNRFTRSREGLFLGTEDAAEFKRLAIEAKAFLDKSLGHANDFSLNLIQSVNSGSGGFFGGPSYACVGEAAAVMRGAVNHVRRQPATGRSSLLKPSYVDLSRLAAVRAVPSRKWDLLRLAQLCRELNVAHENDCHMSVAMLVRAIVDHVPPIFGCENFKEVANNHSGTKSFKKSMQNLDQSLRNIADSFLHVHVRPKESIPTSVQVNFSAELDVLLAEVVRIASTDTT